MFGYYTFLFRSTSTKSKLPNQASLEPISPVTEKWQNTYNKLSTQGSRRQFCRSSEALNMWNVKGTKFGRVSPRKWIINSSIVGVHSARKDFFKRDQLDLYVPEPEAPPATSHPNPLPTPSQPLLTGWYKTIYEDLLGCMTNIEVDDIHFPLTPSRLKAHFQT